jgi:pentatricopeptide repeat protein
MDAAVRVLKTETTWKIFESMKREGIHPDRYTCSILLKALQSKPNAMNLRMVIGIVESVFEECPKEQQGRFIISVLEVGRRLRDLPLSARAFMLVKQQQIEPHSIGRRQLLGFARLWQSSPQSERQSLPCAELDAHLAVCLSALNADAFEATING